MINYSFIHQLLHEIFLGNKLIKKSIFELEKILFLKKNYIKSNKHIFITGLPRSGTTALLNVLNKENDLCSLKYKNMPFVMCPNISKLFKSKKLIKSERYHKDNIFIDLESPESFDEIFFLTYKNNIVFDELINFISLVLSSYHKDRYLSKNNNNFVRINDLKNIFPNSAFIIPVREPLQHSFSLLTQHKNFIQLQTNNNFVLKYMNYLGHYEFGLGHKSWFKPINYVDKFNINYWLEQWYLYYSYIYKNYSNNKSCLIFAYEKLKNRKLLNTLANFAQINKIEEHDFKISCKKINLDFDKNLYFKSKNLYDNFYD
jgi:hypothetical protein